MARHRFFLLTALGIGVVVLCAFLADERNRIAVFSLHVSSPPGTSVLGVRPGQTTQSALARLNAKGIKSEALSGPEAADFCPQPHAEQSKYMIFDDSWRMSMGCIYSSEGRVVRIDYFSVAFML
ncbi:MAG: hypothetical protein DCF28_09615 [Alphaproteobacteria bacterium]|nr:MAG: hypothetical protein DCF28_09615 [Alphaproteobacteria bacterium]